MALVKIEDFDQHYSDMLGDKSIIDYTVYSDVANEKVGTVKDILVDEESGHFRYLIVDTGFWIFGKEILLPIEVSQFDFDRKRVYAKGLTKEQVEHLPEFNSSLRIDHDYEQRVQENYQRQRATVATDPLGNPVSPTVPFSPITIGTLASLASPSVPPYIGHPPDVVPESEQYPPDQTRP